MSLNKKKKTLKTNYFEKIRYIPIFHNFLSVCLYVFTALLTCLHGNFACSFSFATADIKLAEF